MTNGEELRREGKRIRRWITRLKEMGLSREKIIYNITRELQARFPSLSQDTIKKYAEDMLGKIEERKRRTPWFYPEWQWKGWRTRKIKEIKRKSKLFCQKCGKRLEVKEQKQRDGSIKYLLYCPKHRDVAYQAADEIAFERLEYELKEMIEEAKKEIKERHKERPLAELKKAEEKVERELKKEEIEKEIEKEKFEELSEREQYIREKERIKKERGYVPYSPLKIFSKEYREGRRKWKREGRPGLRALRRKRYASFTGKIEKKVGKLIMKGFILACLVGIGVVVSSVVGTWHFTVAFICWGIFYLLPDPGDIKISDEVKEALKDNPLGWSMVNPFSKGGIYVRNAHTSWGFLRSLAKIGTFGFFIWGIYSAAIPLGNIALIILSFAGYYSLKITYDVDKPYQLIESLMRFGLLGFFFIPWIIMYGIFDSILLAFIAMAFFAIPPIPNKRENSELFMMYDFYDKIIFAIIMIGVLIGFLAGWEVTTGLKATFIYFWFVTLIAGFFSPAEARPAMGFLMLGAATIIYGIGPGTQEVMSGLFGPWWPTIQNTFSSITEPIAEAFGGFANTLRSGWLMLTDPVGYATQLMNGTHAENPVGPTGSYGVEITDVTISPIFPEQPFVITTMIMNKGAFDAESVMVFLSTGYEAPVTGLPKPVEWKWHVIPTKWRKEVLNFGEMFGLKEKDLIECHDDDNLEDGCQNKLGKQNIWQLVFTSPERVDKPDVFGVSCDIIEKYKLREKYIPVKVAVNYKYSSDSQVDVEFISSQEWQRLAEANQLSQKLRFILSQYSTAPVEFPIGTPGLKNPILVEQPFHLGMRIEPSGVKGSIENIESVVLEYPKDFELSGDCTPKQTTKEILPDSDFKRLVWKDLTGGPKVFYCPFKGLKPGKLTGPTKTYVIRAHTDYTFTKWREKDTRIEFGGKCCSEKDCLEGQICSPEGMCVAKETATALCPGKCEEPTQLYTAIAATVEKSKFGEVVEAPKQLVIAVMEVESSSKHCADGTVKMSPKGALGIMQLRPDTAEDLKVNPCIYAENIKGGVEYLKQLIDEYHNKENKIKFALAAYNCGPACVDNRITQYGGTWDDIEFHLPATEEYSTLAYVNNVCDIYKKC